MDAERPTREWGDQFAFTHRGHRVSEVSDEELVRCYPWRAPHTQDSPAGAETPSPSSCAGRALSDH